MKKRYLYFNKQKYEFLVMEHRESVIVTLVEFSKLSFPPNNKSNSLEVLLGYFDYEDCYKTYVRVPLKLHFYVQSKKHKDRFIKISKKRAEILHKVMNS